MFQILREHNYRPYLRRVTESLGPLCRVQGARIKRTILSLLGYRVARKAASHGLPGCRQLIGVTDPKYVQRENFWINWVRALNRKVSVEICCHPGYSDTTLIGRDFEEPTGVERRLHEMEQLRDPRFRELVTELGFAVVRPTRFTTDFV